jgi:hypothetical protein
MPAIDVNAIDNAFSVICANARFGDWSPYDATMTNSILGENDLRVSRVLEARSEC